MVYEKLSYLKNDGLNIIIILENKTTIQNIFGKN